MFFIIVQLRVCVCLCDHYNFAYSKIKTVGEKIAVKTIAVNAWKLTVVVVANDDAWPMCIAMSPMGRSKYVCWTIRSNLLVHCHVVVEKPMHTHKQKFVVKARAKKDNNSHSRSHNTHVMITWNYTSNGTKTEFNFQL